MVKVLVKKLNPKVQLPKYNSETFSNFFKKNKDKINYKTSVKDRKVPGLCTFVQLLC